MTNGAYRLQRGDTSDPEDHRMTHRLNVANEMLRSVGIESSVKHCSQCAKHEANRGSGMIDRGCWGMCKTSWPAWVTDEMFQQAFAAADHSQNLHRIAAQAQINARRKVTPLG